MSLARIDYEGPAAAPDAPSPRDAEDLVAALRLLASAHDLPTVMAIVRRAARRLTRADGVTFVLLEGPMVHYADEDAIAPLWKGRRFPATACVSGVAILERAPVVIEDIYADPRVPIDAYRQTFVKSLAMVPIRAEDPVGAIGAYWSSRHRATERQVSLLGAIAAAAGTALANHDLVGRLERAVKLRDEFLALAAHELNTPVAAVRLRVDALTRGEGAPRDGELERLRATVRRLEDVVKGLGDFSRASRDGVPLERASVDLAEVVRRAADEVRSRARTDATGTEVRVFGGQAAGEWDGARLGQAIGHLLDNAVKFGRGAPVDVVIADGAGEATVSVRDRGPGLDESEHARVFERYERASPAESYGGLGLGLWLARAIAEAHGGAITIESTPGLGATFVLRVPKRLPVQPG
jgi:two-component system CheB/CheR fusion protein